MGRISRVLLKSGDFSLTINFETYQSVTTTLYNQQSNVTYKVLNDEQLEQLKALLSSEEEIKIRVNSGGDFQLSNQQRKDMQAVFDYYTCVLPD